jgi:RNA polymerase sigma factor (TIGR02999 family)
MSESPDDNVFRQVYDALRRLAASKLAREPAGHTLEPTALVHEAYLRLGDTSFADRSAYFRAAAVAMQRILVDHARRKRAAKRGGVAKRFDLDAADRLTISDPDVVLDVDAALNRLAREDPCSADIARLRLFSGLSIDEAAEVVGLSRASAFREWAYARSWLTASLAAREDCDEGGGSALPPSAP